VTERVFRETVVGEEGYSWPEDAGVYHFKSGDGVEVQLILKTTASSEKKLNFPILLR